MASVRLVLFPSVLAAFLLALPAHAVTIDWFTVGDPGNSADDTGYRPVAYSCLIGKYQVTDTQDSKWRIR